MTTSEQQHQEDVDAGIGHHVASDDKGSGGKCLNRHAPRQKNNSCSHIWQAFLRMYEENDSEGNNRYNYPAYESLSQGVRKTRIAGLYGKYNDNPNAPKSMAPPGIKDWDLPAAKSDFDKEGGNFSLCYLPYWHEAHHIVPNSTLRSAIEVAVKPASDQPAYKRVVRKSLLEEKYNLNHQHNMMMLPIEAPVGKGMGLPLHRKTPSHRSHSTYSKYVLSELEKFFTEVKEKADKHEQNPDVEKVKTKLESLSERLRNSIFKSSAKSLDDMGEGEFVTKKRKFNS